MKYVDRPIDYYWENRMGVENAMTVVLVAFGINGGLELQRNAKMTLEGKTS